MCETTLWFTTAAFIDKTNVLQLSLFQSLFYLYSFYFDFEHCLMVCFQGVWIEMKQRIYCGLQLYFTIVCAIIKQIANHGKMWNSVSNRKHYESPVEFVLFGYNKLSTSICSGTTFTQINNSPRWRNLYHFMSETQTCTMKFSVSLRDHSLKLNANISHK